MKCPVCSAEIKDDQLYCEKCGYEIRIVPDFEPEVETHIQDSLTDFVSDFSDADAEDEDGDWNAQEDRPILFEGICYLIRKHKILSAALLFVIAAAVVIAAVKITASSRKKTYDYCYDKGVKAAARGEYEEAIEYMKQALSYDNQKMEARLLIADYYLQLGGLDQALDIYLDLSSLSEYRALSYEKIVMIYETEKKYMELCMFMEKCTDASLRAKYSRYLAPEPIFSISGNLYEDEQLLELTSDHAKGRIFYTLDGSVPDEQSEPYTEPILLKAGECNVSAVYINEYGMKSKVRTEYYRIVVQIPLTPSVYPKSGNYTMPSYIHVEAPADASVYYTIDGTMPDYDSTPYTADICMPLGNSTYRFIAYSENMIASEATRVDYYFVPEGFAITPQEAAITTITGLLEQGFLVDAQGHAAGRDGIFTYEARSAFIYRGDMYYLVSEYHTAKNGTVTESESKYAVSAAYGTLFRTYADNNGHFTVYTFE